MAGEKYSNGFEISDGGSALFNLNSKYSSIEMTIGHVDGSGDVDQTVSFLVDGKLVKEVTVGFEELPKTISIPVQYGLQLKIVTSEYRPDTGFANVTVR